MRGTLKNTVSCQRWRPLNRRQAWTKPTCTWSPLRQDLRFPHDWLKTSDLPGYSHYDWVDHSGRVHQISSATKVTYISIIPALGGSTLEFHGIWVEALGSSHPFWLSYTADWYWAFPFEFYAYNVTQKVLPCIEISILANSEVVHYPIMAAGNSVTLERCIIHPTSKVYWWRCIPRSRSGALHTYLSSSFNRGEQK